MTTLALFLAVLYPSAPGVAVRPVHTYPIVARDPSTVAVQSHWLSVGSSVVWAEAGVGAIATQSFIDPSYGNSPGLRHGLELGDARASPPAIGDPPRRPGSPGSHSCGIPLTIEGDRS